MGRPVRVVGLVTQFHSVSPRFSLVCAVPEHAKSPRVALNWVTRLTRPFSTLIRAAARRRLRTDGVWQGGVHHICLRRNSGAPGRYPTTTCHWSLPNFLGASIAGNFLDAEKAPSA